MEPERWQQIDQIVAAALEREEGERSAYLDEACGGDEALRRKVETLLVAHKEAEDFLEEPAVEMVAEGFAKDEADTLVGSQLGSYKIISFIAAGGMGEVYRARDTQLDREVAIKVLPAEFTQDPERLARFQREAKLLAALNHPNIAAIYGLEESDGIRFLVLELVEGQTLAEKVAKGPLPVEEVLEVCRQIAEGVEAAHEKGVIHRDLKPANVKVTPEGKVKVLDFGLAKAFESETPVTDISQSPTLTEEMTRAGVILGTAAYMSPEQAKGKPVDKRADIFAFGAVLYELLTGKRAFEGETITETIAKVLESEPKWELLPENTPWTIRSLLRRCLQKDLNDRLDGIANVRIEVKLALSEPATDSPTGVSSIVPPLRQRWMTTVGVVVVTATIAVLITWILMQSSPDTQRRVNKFLITTSLPARLSASPGNDVAISPDGKHVVYRVNTERGGQFYLRSLEDFVDRPIPGTEGSGGSVFFSPDGESIGFIQQGKLKKLSLVGGSPITLCDVSGGRSPGNWFENTIVFTTGEILYRVPASGGEPEILASVKPDEGELEYFAPHFLPGGTDLLLTIQTSEGTRIVVLSLESGERKVLLENARQPSYLPTGHLIYEQSRTGNLMVVPFDLASLEVAGDPVSVVQQVRQDVSNVDYSVSGNGTLVYVPSTTQGRPHDHTLVWVDRDGKETLITQEKRPYLTPRISPDGKRMAVSIGGYVSVYDFESDSFSRLTFENERASDPIWSPDGRWLIFQSGPPGGEDFLVRQPFDGSRSQERLTSHSQVQAPSSWTPDGQYVVFYQLGEPGGHSIGILPMEGDPEPKLIVASAALECCAVISPDGKWLAYVSNQLGPFNVYVSPFPEPNVKWLISKEEEGGGQPIWSPDGKELFYRSGNRMMVVPIQVRDQALNAGNPRVLFEGSYVSHPSPPGVQYYDISPDGNRFLMMREGDLPTEQGQIHVILDWFEELKRLVATGE
jgi:serine/threonine protein kinase